METMWSLYGMIGLIVLASLIGYGAMILVTNPHSKDITAVSSIRAALRIIGVEKPAWRTLIISSSLDVKVPLEAVWSKWTRLEEWPAWSNGMIGQARWVTGEGWQTGARFEQVVKLGFPYGTRTSQETVEEFDEMHKVRWCKTSGGILSCHVWSFAYLPNGKTRITNTEVFHGTMIGLIKPLVAGRWERMFKNTVDGLVKQAQKS